MSEPQECASVLGEDPVLHISVREDGVVVGKVPWSIRYWLTALYIVFRSDFLCASLALPSCLAGLMAMMTIPANIAIIATTNSISNRVKALRRLCFLFIKMGILYHRYIHPNYLQNN